MSIIYQAYGSCGHALPSKQQSHADDHHPGDGDDDGPVEHALLDNRRMCHACWWLRALGRCGGVVATRLLVAAGSALVSAHLGAAAGWGYSAALFRELCIFLVLLVAYLVVHPLGWGGHGLF